MNETFDEDTLVRLASLLAPGFIRSAEGFFSTRFCHERLERVINSNSNHAKPSPPLPVPGQVDLSHPGASPAPGLQQGPGTAGAACGKRQLSKRMPQFAVGGKVGGHRGCAVIRRCFHKLLSLCSQCLLPKTELQDKKTQLLLWHCNTRLAPSAKNQSNKQQIHLPNLQTSAKQHSFPQANNLLELFFPQHIVPRL